MTNVESSIQRALNAASRLQERCVGCGTCTQRCDLLEARQWNVADVCTETQRALEGVSDLGGLQHAVEAHDKMYSFVRSCEACDRCTARCPQGLSMGELWRTWRALVRAGGYITDADVNLVNVDRPWHTFSVYRALNGVDYSDLPLLQIPETENSSQPQPVHAETLFFPGCTLASYAPELTRVALSWLQDNVGPCLLTEQCCAWPLECAGEIERTVAWREKIVKVAHAQGVKRIVTVCPGCEKQLAAAAKNVAPSMEFVSFAQLLIEAGVRVEAHMLDSVALPVTVVDSCNDRAGAHGPFVRQLFEDMDTRPFPCTGQDAWCCGAGGNVAAYSMQLSRNRTRRSFSLCTHAGASTLVTACPTCAYTYAFECWLSLNEDKAEPSALEETPLVPNVNYLEIVFGKRIDWPAVFNALVDMWQGEHADWVAERIG